MKIKKLFYFLKTLFFYTARPSPPRNCTVFTGNDSSWIDDATKEETSEYLEVRCVAGYDGGLPQLVVLEALDSITGRIRFNVTANETSELLPFYYL